MANQIKNRSVYQREYRKRKGEELLEKKRKWWRGYYLKNQERLLRDIQRKKWALKEEVLTHYGNGRCACVLCRFDDIRALSIDHIAGNGTKERVQLKNKGGVTFYRWLRKRGYPEGYQTLCMNCQFIKRIEKKEYLR